MRATMESLLHHPMSAWCWSVLIVLLCLVPGQEVPGIDVVGVDKLGHIALFAGFYFLWRIRASAPPVIRVVVLGCLLAVGTELLQWITPFGRTADVLDVVADIIGLIVGFGMTAWTARRDMSLAVPISRSEVEGPPPRRNERPG